MEWLKRLFGKPTRSASTERPLETRVDAFVRLGTVEIDSGALAAGSGESPVVTTFLELGTWTAFVGRADVETCLVLVRPTMATAGECVEQFEGSLLVDNGCVYLADAEHLEDDAVHALLTSEEQLEPRRWPPQLVSSSTGIGDGIFPLVTVNEVGDHQHDRLGLMAVVASFTATPTLEVLRQLAASLPPWPSEEDDGPEPVRTPAFTRDHLGRWELALSDRSTLTAALRGRTEWALADLRVVSGSNEGVRREGFTVFVEVSPALADRLAAALEAAAPGDRLAWDELPDFTISTHAPVR